MHLSVTQKCILEHFMCIDVWIHVIVPELILETFGYYGKEKKNIIFTGICV